MPAIHCQSTTCSIARRIRRATRAVVVIVGGSILWSACSSGDATAPIQPTPPEVTSPPPAGALVVENLVAPDTVGPGAVLVFEGAGFVREGFTPVVSLKGVPATVISATSTRLHVRLPEAATFPCLLTGSYPVRVAVGAQVVERPITVAVARRVALGRGQSLNMLEASATWCTELVAPAGESARYAVAVMNTSRMATTSTSFQVRAAALGAGSATAAPMMMPGIRANGGFGTGALEAPDRVASEEIGRAAAHGAHLGREMGRATRAGSAASQWQSVRRAGDRAAMTASVRAPMVLGQMVRLNAMFASCGSATPVTARVVYVGARAVVLEDVASPHAGRMDAEYRAIGEEFDAVQYPLLVAKVGDPLALDAAMGGDGRISMLFTPYVNDSAPGTAGYVTTCNLYPRSMYASSNEDELFYARVPNAAEAPAEWRRNMRSTVMHEAKHLAAFAERLSRGLGLEEPWLEEATARVAEELYARTFRAHDAPRQNIGWTESVYCEMLRCDDRPIVMWGHFPALHDYFAGADSLTPLGGASASDFTFYASGWSLVRWTLDHHASDEGAFLRDLVRGTGVSGIEALALRTGRPAEELLAEWSLANLLDDRPGFTPERSTLSFPSWNLPELMAGLADMHSARYSAAPLRVHELRGDAQVVVPQLRAFSASFLEAVVEGGGAQLVELRGAGGEGVSAAIRMAVVRVE